MAWRQEEKIRMVIRGEREPLKVSGQRRQIPAGGLSLLLLQPAVVKDQLFASLSYVSQMDIFRWYNKNELLEKKK